jgi:peroxiredoxin
LRHDRQEYESRGVRLLGVAVQKRSRLAAYLENNPLPFPMLADEDRSVARSYGVYVALNFESLRIARPATFLIDASRTIRFIHVGRHQFDRPRPREVLDVVDRLSAGGS